MSPPWPPPKATSTRSVRQQLPMRVAAGGACIQYMPADLPQSYESGRHRRGCSNVGGSNFSRSVQFPPTEPDWQPDFLYHGRNLYGYLLAKYGLHTFDFISIQLYEVMLPPPLGAMPVMCCQHA